MSRPATLNRYVDAVTRAGRAGISSDEIAAALGVARRTANNSLRAALDAGLLRMRRLHRCPAMWYAPGAEPEDRASVLAVGKPLTVKSRERLVLRLDQPTIVPPTVRVTICPTRWT